MRDEIKAIRDEIKAPAPPPPPPAPQPSQRDKGDDTKITVTVNLNMQGEYLACFIAANAHGNNSDWVTMFCASVLVALEV